MPSSPSPTATPSANPSQAQQDRQRPQASPGTSAASLSSSLPPRLSLPDTSAEWTRRPSIQFASHHRTETNTTGKVAGPKIQRRRSSPPPPGTFENRVSFDTFDNKDASDYSLTLKSKHKDYKYTPRSRTFLCGTDQNEYSDYALEWLIDELVEDGDEVIVLRVVDKDAKISSDASVAERKYQAEAKKLLDSVIEKNTVEKAISLVLEYTVGKVQETIQRMIQVYEPAILIVGTRGKSLSGFQGLLPGSVSKYCLQHSPVPVIVVRSGAKREEKKMKRQNNPGRKGYLDILEKSGAEGSHMVDGANRFSLIENAGPATAEEAKAVAAAIGQPRPRDSHARFSSLSKVQSQHAAAPADDEALSEGPRSPGVIMKSPTLSNMESPAVSDGEASEDDSDDDEGGSKFEVIPGSMLATTPLDDLPTQEKSKKDGQGMEPAGTGDAKEDRVTGASSSAN
ncbi:MAG: hypothetical protein M1825_004951 [Sarcosagium campestre]|nr:MAG: hypothetical protein M1825_004951 [Sarcosagium campestre]